MANDIRISEDGMLKVANGDFDIGRSDQQHALLLLATEKGEWRHQPLLGIGLSQFINDERPDVLMKQAIRVQMDADGASIDTLAVKAGTIELEANYG